MCNHKGNSEDSIMSFDPGMGVIPVREPWDFVTNLARLVRRPKSARSMRFGRVCVIPVARDLILSMQSSWTLGGKTFALSSNVECCFSAR